MNTPIQTSITSITPDSAASGSTVIIKGSNLIGADKGGAVNFGKVGSTQFQVSRDGLQITAVVPLENPGPVQVQVTVPHQTGSNLLPFTVVK